MTANLRGLPPSFIYVAGWPIAHLLEDHRDTLTFYTHDAIAKKVLSVAGTTTKTAMQTNTSTVAHGFRLTPWAMLPYYDCIEQSGADALHIHHEGVLTDSWLAPAMIRCTC